VDNEILSQLSRCGVNVWVFDHSEYDGGLTLSLAEVLTRLD
jgi:hypothetical protein